MTGRHQLEIVDAQTHRVELNAMTTPEFIEWLDGKIAEHGDGKLIPPEEVVAAELENRLEAKVRTIVTERILLEAGLEDQIAKAMDAIKRPTGNNLTRGIKSLFKHEPEREWRDHIEAVAAERTSKV